MTTAIQRSKIYGLGSFLIAICAILLSACATSLTPPGGQGNLAGTENKDPNSAENSATRKRRNTTRIALLLPLSGFSQRAATAKGMKQAAELALFEQDRPNVELIVKDDGGTADGAKQAAQQAIEEGAEIILGPLLSEAVAGAATVSRPANIPIIAFSNNSQIAGQGVYLMSYLPRPEVERIVRFASARGKRRFAALLPDNAYGQAIEPVFRAAVSAAGGTVEVLERYPSRTNAMLDAANRMVDQIKQRNFEGTPIDALFLPGGQDVLSRLGPLITFSGIETAKVQLLGTGSWATANIGREKAFIGGWYPSPEPEGWRAFSGRFAKTFGYAPPRFASLAYDATTLAISLSDLPRGQRFLAQNLTRPSGFQGVDGTFRFTQNGLSDRTLAILEVQSFGAQVIDRAPNFLSRTQYALPKTQNTSRY